MAKPKGTLTSAQLEILEAIWSSQEMGATVTEIWDAITRQRAVTRTTVLTQVDRLEKRGWLRRKKHGDGFRYLAVVDRDEATRDVAEQFLDAFFGGSASELVMSSLSWPAPMPTIYSICVSRLSSSPVAFLSAVACL